MSPLEAVASTPQLGLQCLQLELSSLETFQFSRSNSQTNFPEKFPDGLMESQEKMDLLKDMNGSEHRGHGMQNRQGKFTSFVLIYDKGNIFRNVCGENIAYLKALK